MSTTPDEHIALWHFTCARNWQAIQQSQFLRVTDHQVMRRAAPGESWTETERADQHRFAPVTVDGRRVLVDHGRRFVVGVPAVVWLTDEPSPDAHEWMGRGKPGMGVDKSEVRIEVHLPRPEVHHWPLWSREQGIDSDWYDQLARGGDPERWWICPRRIRARGLAGAVNTITGHSYVLRVSGRG